MKNKSDLVNEISKSGAGNVTKDQALAVLNKAFSVIGSYLNAGEEVRINDFGTFSVSERSAREGRNPATGEAIQIAASKSVKFKPARMMKEAVN